MSSPARSCALALLIAAFSGECAPKPAGPVAIRLTDYYRPEMVAGVVPQVASPRPIEWHFDGSGLSPATSGWEAGLAISGLSVKGGRLVGRATTDFPILHLKQTSGLDDHDLIHEIQVRMRVSGGHNLFFSSRSSEKIDLTEVRELARDIPWALTTPLVPGEQTATYTLRGPTSLVASDLKHLLIRPTDEAGATFEIESIRLVSRKEHLLSVPSGVRDQAPAEIYTESLVSRTPQTIAMNLELPERPWLDLAVGTIEDEPLTFRVDLGDGTRQKRVLEHTVTTPHRWDSVPVDLQRFAGQRVVLSLSLASEKGGALGFWGAPTLRSRGVMPRPSLPRALSGEPPQGIVLIWTDTLRQDHLGLYGYKRETAPVLRRMATEGTFFRDCLVQATWTKVSTPSLMSSLYPTSHGVKDFYDRLPTSATTLPEVYRAAGYATLGLSSSVFVGKLTNLHRGFEELHEALSFRAPDARETSPLIGKTARIYVDRLLPWLDAHREEPFFVLLHVTDPHDPYKPYRPYDTLFANPSLREKHEQESRAVQKFIADPNLRRFGMPNREELTKAGIDADAYVSQEEDWYDGSIRAMDVEIGRLLEGLRRLGLDNKTLIVFTGDHGEEFLEHGRMFHGQSTYGELSNVPLIFWGPPFVGKGVVVEPTVQDIDLMPTLLEVSGLAAPAGLQGRSLVPLLRASGERSRWRHAAIVEKAFGAKAVPPQETESFAIVEDGWKLVHNSKRSDGRPEYELYAHQKDPLDRKDLAAEHAAVVDRLSRDLAAWKASAEAARLKPDAETTKQLSNEELDRLRSLGYIQ